MSFKSEFRLRMFGFADTDMRDVYLMKSRYMSIISLVGRCVAAAYFVAVLVMSGLTYNTPKWPIFLTNWNVLLYTSYFIAEACLSGYLWCKQRKSIKSTQTVDLRASDADEMQIGVNPNETASAIATTEGPSEPAAKVLGVIVWMLMEISIVLTFIIVLLYWIVLTGVFSGGYLKYSETKQQKFVEINTHGVNLVLLLLDFALHRIPVRVLHFIYVFVVAALYIVLSVVYSLVTEKALYGLLAWHSSPGSSAAVMVGVFVTILLVHLALYGLHRLKMLVYRKIRCE